jgi:hypothetical protein
MEVPKTHSHFIRNLFFIAGIIATLAYRAIGVIENQTWIHVLWYTGTIGFIIYFIHRYQISKRRAQLIAANNLEQKISQIQTLSELDKASMAYIFGTLRSSKEKWNSVVIFASSIAALILGIYFDFFANR